MHTIEYFMWGYQIHFRVSAQTSAESVLSRLDPNLKPNVFLIGILSEDLKDRHPVCLEPEDCDYELSIFTDIRKQAEHYQATDPE